MSFLESIFDLLEDNQKFPYYQAERRIDIFINFFLNDIVRQHTPYTDAKFIVPEFPLKKGLTTDHAAHVDYLMISYEKKTILLVELKTDDISYSPKQIGMYLLHTHFKEWIGKFEEIKMKGFETKRNKLLKVLNENIKGNIEEFKVGIIVLKPTTNQGDLLEFEGKSESLHYISLRNLHIVTQYQDEWDLFRKKVLEKLGNNEFTKIFEIGKKGTCTEEELHFFLPDLPVIKGSEIIFTIKWIGPIRKSSIKDIEDFIKGLHHIEEAYKKVTSDFGFGSPSPSFKVIGELRKRDNIKADEMVNWIARSGGNYYIPRIALNGLSIK